MKLLLLVVSGICAAACGEDDPAPGTFGATCEADADCDTGRCFEFGSKGKRCTMDCPSDPSSCPNDGEGCNDKGVCKVE